MRKYFIHNGVAENGPLSIEQLKKYPLKNDTPVWYEGMENWVIAGNLSELKLLLEGDTIPSNFNKFTSDLSNVQPPRFIDSTAVNAPNLALGKKKNARNIFIILGFFLLLFIGLISFSNADSDLYYDENGIFIEINTGASVDEAKKNRINEKLSIKNRNYRNNFKKYILVSTNQYSYNVFGGISNLDVIVFNDTEYTLNEVTINVDYVNDNGDIYKSESVIINNIPAYQNKSISAPESSRGTSIDVRIDGINSKKMHFCFFATNGIGTFSEPEFPEDPYFCR